LKKRFGLFTTESTARILEILDEYGYAEGGILKGKSK